VTVCLIEKGVEIQHFASPHMLFFIQSTSNYITILIRCAFDESSNLSK